MKPLTPRVFAFWVARAVGIPYRAWRHAGVMVVAQEAGTAFDVKLTSGIGLSAGAGTKLKTFLPENG